MKRYILSLFTIASSLFVGCQQNDAPFEITDYSDYSIISSAFNHFTSTGNIAIGTTVEFMNLSKGNSNSFWEIDPGCYFLTSDYAFGMSDYTPYIIPDQLSYTRDTQANVLFTEAGTFAVRVYNEFDEYVCYDPAPSRDDLNLGDKAVYNRKTGKWVADYSFTINVIDNAGLSFALFVGDELVHTFERNFEYDANPENWDVVEIGAGESIRYEVVETFGSPDAIKYEVEGGKATYLSSAVEQGSAATVTYAEAGEFAAGAITISRSSDFVRDVDSSSNTITIPLKIKVSEAVITE